MYLWSLTYCIIALHLCLPRQYTTLNVYVSLVSDRCRSTHLVGPYHSVSSQTGQGGAGPKDQDRYSSQATVSQSVYLSVYHLNPLPPSLTPCFLLFNPHCMICEGGDLLVLVFFCGAFWGIYVCGSILIPFPIYLSFFFIYPVQRRSAWIGLEILVCS